MAFGQRACGREDARRVIEAHYDDVLAYCRRHTQTADEAQDVAQEVFLRFVRTADRYRDAGKPLAYLLTIARNVCIDAGRARSWALFELPDDEVLVDPAAGPATAEERDDADGLRRALDALPQDMRELLELRFDQELKLAEIARVLGISRFSVRRRIDAALAVLREEMDV